MTYALDGAGPVYRQIKRAISAPILSGRLEPGARLPSEHDFMSIFATSRMTVNRALQMLADDGLVVRHRRNGTFVAPQVAEHAVMEVRDTIDEVESTGAAYGYELITSRKGAPPKAIAERLDIRRGEKILRLRCRHFADGIPFVLEDRFINMRTVPLAATAAFSEVPPSKWLLDNVPWSRAEHAILAVNAAADLAALLDVVDGAACLRVERTTWHAELPVTFVTLTYPGNTHRLIGTFTPGK